MAENKLWLCRSETALALCGTGPQQHRTKEMTHPALPPLNELDRWRLKESVEAGAMWDVSLYFFLSLFFSLAQVLWLILTVLNSHRGHTARSCQRDSSPILFTGCKMVLEKCDFPQTGGRECTRDGEWVVVCSCVQLWGSNVIPEVFFQFL